LVLNEDLITKEVQHDLDEMGIAKNAREEKQRARAERLRRDQENARMAKLYRQHILKEEPTPEVQLVKLSASRRPNGAGD
jgi:hypothetical protein